MIQNNKTLILFTSAFPYGKSETFLETELPYLSQAFKKVFIIHNEVNETKREIPSNIELVHFPYNLTSNEKKEALKEVFSSSFWNELLRLHFRYRRTLNKGIFATMILSLYKSKKLKAFLDTLFQERKISKSTTLLYSYWCNDIAFALSQYKKHHPEIKAISRAHGWDVYFEVSQFNYLPFRKEILQNLDFVSFISDYGKEYTKKMNPSIAESKMKVSRLGVHNAYQDVWKSSLSEDGTFRIVSCSNLIPLKRVDLLVESLAEILKKDIDKPIEWVHFGDGVEMDKVESLAKKLLEGKMKYELKGRITNPQLLEYYHQHTIDVFVNLSASEGIPVSIMEAMSFGISVLATNVGGVSEIVDELNGKLLDSNPSHQEISEQLLHFIHSKIEKKIEKSKKAWSTWNEKYNAKRNYNEFMNSLNQKSIIPENLGR